MVILQPSLPTHVKLHPKLPVFGSVRACQKPPLNLHSSSSSSSSSSSTPNLSISNSQHHQCHPLMFPPTSQSVAAIVFGDGSDSDSRLYPLTKRRSEGAVPIGANYRLIDAVVSNCINSNINKIYALTQFNSTSLNSHLSRAYSGVGLGKDGFVEVIAAYQSPEYQGWFQGSADAIRRCLWVLEEYPVLEFLVLPGHHLYKMDYQKLIEAHRNSQADITIAALSAMRIQDPGFGFLQVNSQNQIVRLLRNSNIINKPERELSNLISSVGNSSGLHNFASMGIYVINRDIMIKLLREHFPKANHLASEVIPGALSVGMKVEAYVFDGYWEEMRSIEAFYRANMESTNRSNSIGYNFHDKEFPVYTWPRHLPPTIVTDAVITESLIGGGCILNKCKIKGAVVGFRTRIGDGAVIEDSVIMGSDTYQTEEEVGIGRKGNSNGSGGSRGVPIGIGENSYIRKAIIDRNARIGKSVMIMNKEKVEEGNREEDGYIITGGIVVVLKNAVIPDGTIL